MMSGSQSVLLCQESLTSDWAYLFQDLFESLLYFSFLRIEFEIEKMKAGST